MPSYHQKNNDRSMYVPKTPHFFKIILDDTIRDGKLAIPRRFLRDYGNCLPNSLLLKVPSGAEWQVQLTKCDGEVWLQNGWQEFAEYYSVAHGHFLVFGYDGSCHFNVLIFDRSASEIEYPYTSTNLDGEFQNPKIKETEEDISHDILDDISPSRKTREKSSLPCPRPHKMMRTNPTDKTESTSRQQLLFPNFRLEDNKSGGMKLEDSKKKLNSHHSMQQSGGGHNFPAKKGAGSKSSGKRCRQTEALKRMKALIANEKAKAFQRASAFKSKNPYFRIVMQPSYVHRHKLSVPVPFARSYFMKEQGEIILCISDGRTWPVKYCCKPCKGFLGAKLLDGWRAFVQDNNLEVGDVCVFELIKGNEISLKVIIFRLVDDSNCRLSRINGSGANRVGCKRRSAVDGTKSDYDSDDKNCMPSQSNQVTTKEFQWPKIEDEENDMSVEILAEVEPSKIKQLIHEERAGMQFTERPSCSRTPEALEAANKFISKYPFFKITLRPNNLLHNNVSVSLIFIEKYLKQNESQNVILQVANRSWHVKLISYPRHHVGKFSSGWAAFARENSLRAGDVCVFELIKRGKAVLKVSIFRCVS